MYNAVQISRNSYRNVRRRVITEIQEIKRILSEVAPLIQIMICPKLASSFANNIFLQYQRIENEIGPGSMVQERHDDLCVAMLRSVLTPCLYEYQPDIMSDPFTRNLVFQSLDSVPGLRKLSFSREVGINRSAQLATFIPHLKELQVFHYADDCSDEVVRQLGLNCPNLTDVSFLNCFRVTNNCVPHLLRLSNLQLLCIDGTQIDSLHYGQLLSGLPKISNVKFIDREDDLLSHIALETVDTVTYVHGVVNDINMLIQKFPRTQKFVLSETYSDLSDLTAWTELRNLEISYGDIPTINLNAILTGIGDKLTELKLEMDTHVNLLDILTLCKSLKSLSLDSCLISPLNADTPINPQLPHFSSLISLKIEKSIEDPTDFSFIRYYVNLERIKLRWIHIFTEEFMREAIRLGTLANLKEFYLYETLHGVLTFAVLQLFLQHCPHLKIFGHTAQLPNLNALNVIRLRRQLSEQNFDIDLMP
jgi:hypothetical protein